MPVTNTDFNGTGRNPSIGLYTSRGYKVDSVKIRFQLPAQYARKVTDAMCYDSTPGINILSQIETTLSGQYSIETLQPLQILTRYIDSFGIDRFKYLATKFFGGYFDEKNCDFNQKLTPCRNSTLSTDISQNIIKPAIWITLFMPSSLLFNREKYNYWIGSLTPIEWKLIFKPIESIATRQGDMILTPLSGTIDVYIENLNINELGTFFRGASYLHPSDTPYVVQDNYIESNTKAFSSSQDIKINPKPCLTTEMGLYGFNKIWSSNLVYFGNTCISAVGAWACSLFVPTLTNTSKTVINLRTGAFINGVAGVDANGGATSSAGNWTVSSFTSASRVTSFLLTYTPTSNRSFTTIISIEGVSLGTEAKSDCIWMDLGVYDGTIYKNINTLQPYYFSEIRYRVEPYTVVANDTIDHMQEIETTFGSAVKLARGQFTFKDNTNNVFALWGCNRFVINDSVITSSIDGISDYNTDANKMNYAVAFLASKPVPPTNTVNVLVSKSFVKINRNNYPFEDLDAQYKIHIDKVSLEKIGSNQDQYQNFELEMVGNVLEPPHRWSPQVSFNFGYKDLFDANLKTNGYCDLRALDIISVSLELQKIEIRFNNQYITDNIKEFSNLSFDYEIVLLQKAVRFLKYTNSELTIVTDDDRENINRTIINNVLIPNGLYAPANDQQNLMESSNSSASKRKIGAVYSDNYSASNQSIAKKRPINQFSLR